MNQLKAFWTYLNGKKTTIAALYWGTVMPGLLVLYPAGVPGNVNKWVTLVGLLLTSLGLGHKAAKAYLDAQQ